MGGVAQLCAGGNFKPAVWRHIHAGANNESACCCREQVFEMKIAVNVC
jgi:hypothetical protein